MATKFRIVQLLLLCATLLSGAAAALFGFLYFSLYWPYRNLFNEEGRYYDEQALIVYHEQDGFLIAPTLVFLSIAIVFIFSWRARRRRELNRLSE
ncbi:MAG: hypothetical protein LBE21_08940 [Pseudomonadales bacterium]|jgi:hypothetical protein|nr:hypothetical protein [Pseudomonadales bacterium]